MFKKEEFRKFWIRLKNDKVYSTSALMYFLFLILFLLAIFYFFVPRTCGYDDACFQKSMIDCSRAKVFKVLDSNTYLYELKGTYKDSCVLNIKVVELAGVQDKEIKQKLEGRGMLCKIPKDKLGEVEITKLDNLLDYCTGPLKEGMLEIILQKFYEQVVQNMGNLSINLEK